MTPDYNSLAATYAAQAETLAALDTEGLYECLTVGCCNLTDTQLFTYLEIINAILLQYTLTGELPVWPTPCCRPVCGSFEGGTTFVTPGETTTVALRNLAGTVVQGRIYYGSGTLAAGTATIAAPWVTAASIINATYTVAAGAGQVNISRGTITPNTNFVINGEGTNTFNWTAFVPS